jgi:hypothetical protein
MDYSLAKKNPLNETIPKNNPKRAITPGSSPLRPLNFSNAPSPDHSQTAGKHGLSSLYKDFLDHPTSTQHHTPLGISRSRLLSAVTPEDIDQFIVEHRY